jgi:hypothetical protein
VKYLVSGWLSAAADLGVALPVTLEQTTDAGSEGRSSDRLRLEQRVQLDRCKDRRRRATGIDTGFAVRLQKRRVWIRRYTPSAKRLGWETWIRGRRDGGAFSARQGRIDRASQHSVKLSVIIDWLPGPPIWRDRTPCRETRCVQRSFQRPAILLTDSLIRVSVRRPSLELPKRSLRSRSDEHHIPQAHCGLLLKKSL